MTTLYVLIFVTIILMIAASLIIPDYVRLKRQYQYKRKTFFMSKAEHECFDAITKAVGDKYIVFAQVHLPTIVDNKVIGQNWKFALRHINQKSVDFVLCDKVYISPVLAIELDDSTHELPERQARDGEVERILKSAGVPLLRLENHGQFNSIDIAQKVTLALNL